MKLNQLPNNFGKSWKLNQYKLNNVAPMKKILFTTSTFDQKECHELIELQQRGFELVFNPHKRRLSECEVRELLDPQVVAILAGVEPLTRNVLSGALGLKVVSRCGVGLDSVDLMAASELDIVVRNTPDAPSLPVAELALAQMLNLLRHVSCADRTIRSGKWSPLMGALLSNKTIGIVGFGRVGRQLTKVLAGFDVNILIADPNTSLGAINGNIKKTELDSLLVNSDIVSLHLPYTPESHHIIDSRALGLMRNNAYLINISRGGLVDEVALADALMSGVLAGAALDVFEDEPYAGPLLQFDNVVLTSHMGSYAKESRARMEQEAVSNLFIELKKHRLVGWDKA